MRGVIAALVSSLLLLPAEAATLPRTLVVWAPGHPGTTEEAQPAMDEFADSVRRRAGWEGGALQAVYHPTVEGGRGALAAPGACLALVPTPVVYEYGFELGLRPELRVVQPTGGEEAWSLVAKKGRVSSSASLAGWEVVGTVGYAPRFVRGPVLGAWGELPPSARIEFTPRALAALRRAVAGENVAVVADGAQAGALAALPFGGELEVVARSPELPSSFLCAVTGRLPAADAASLRRAFLSLDDTEAGRQLLAALRMTRFEPVDPATLNRLQMPR
jgi:hypothetical protein